MKEENGRYDYAPESFTLEEKANFDRCINFMARMLEKYEADVSLPETSQNNSDAKTE